MSGRPLLLLLSPVIAAAQNANLQGTTVNAIDGQPLGGVHVQLMPAPSDGSGNVYGAMSNRAGQFSMANLPPGAYFMRCDRNGFVLSQSGRQRRSSGSVTLKPGENVTDFKIEMTPQAVIMGRVLDRYGDPMQYVRIQISPAAPADGSLAEGTLTSTSTDDRGEFRVTGKPGRYYIEAVPNRRSAFGGQEIRTDGTSTPAYVSTYFPGTPSKDHATAIEAKAGSEVSGIDIRLSTTRSTSISGQVTGIPDGSTSPVVWILSKEDDDRFSSFNTVTTDARGHFTFSSLQPRTYTLLAQWLNEKTRLLSQAQKVQLADAEVSGIVLSLGPPSEITGIVEIPGIKPEARGQITSKLSVGLNALDFAVYSLRTDPAPVDKEGAFHMGPIAPTRCRVELANLPDNAYIKTLLLDGVPAPGNGRDEIDFSAVTHSSTVKIILSLNGAEIAGVIRDKDGAVMTRSFVNIFLADDPKVLKYAKRARVKPDGSFQFSGIRPGRYRIFALDMMQRTATDLNEAAAGLAAKAEEIVVKDGDRITKNLTPSELTPANVRKEP